MSKIFTIGYRPSYDPHVGEPDFKKLGKRPPFDGHYAGGSMWQTREDAAGYLLLNSPRLDDYSVYGVLADWETQTEQIEGEPFRRLLVDALIVSANDG